jgi:hypothetical protein
MKKYRPYLVATALLAWIATLVGLIALDPQPVP